MELVRARPEQADALTRISIAAKSHWGYSDALMRDWEASLTITRSSIASRPTFIAVCDGEPAGFYQLAFVPPLVVLEHLWVRPDRMGTGIGRALLQHARDQARATITLEAEPHAEAFYAACGAITVGRVPAPIPGQPERFLPKMALRHGAAR